MKLVFKLKKVAQKSGGDRYTTKTVKGEEFDVYFPQSISRKDGQVSQTITCTLEV